MLGRGSISDGVEEQLGRTSTGLCEQVVAPEAFVLEPRSKQF